MTDTVIAEAKPSSIVTITSENAQAFYDEKLGVGVDAAGDDAHGGSDSAPGGADTQEGGEADDEIKKESKGNKKIESRFSELAKQRREAEEKAKAAAEEARAAREEKLAIERERDELKAKYEPPKQALGPKPKLDQFQNAEEYEQAIDLWTAEKVERDLAAKDAEAKERARNETLTKNWRERQDAFRKGVEDYDSRINASTVAVSDAVKEAILESDVGPALLYHLATNDDAVKLVMGVPDATALRAIGRLEAKLSEKPAEPKTALADMKAEISKAPPPPVPIRASASGHDTPRVDSDGKYHGSFKQYVADRQAGRIK